MLRLNARRRALVANKVADIANLITAAVVIGFVIGGPAASGPLVLGAIAVWLALLVFAVWIEEEHS